MSTYPEHRNITHLFKATALTDRYKTKIKICSERKITKYILEKIELYITCEIGRKKE